MSRARRFVLFAAVAGVAFAAVLLGWRAGVGPPSAARTEGEPTTVPRPPAEAPSLAGAVPEDGKGDDSMLPTVAMAPPPPPPMDNHDPTPVALTPAGASRALEAISKNEQTRRLFLRLQPLGLSRVQRERVLLILGTQALRPSQESPSLDALRARGGSQVLSDEEARRVRDERQEIAERSLRSLRPALAAVLTPSQLARAGLAGADEAPAGKGKGKGGGEGR